MNSRMTPWLLACAVLAGAGASAADRAVREMPSHRFAQRSDDWINDSVKQALKSHKSVSPASADVDVKDGVVTIRGDADTEAQKELVTEYARQIDGVKDVDNQMTVKESGYGDAYARPLDDAAITTRVKSALALHRATSAINTSVSTNNGTVTLTGTARSDAEKELAELLAKGVPGVKGVDNKMSISPSASVPSQPDVIPAHPDDVPPGAR